MVKPLFGLLALCCLIAAGLSYGPRGDALAQTVSGLTSAAPQAQNGTGSETGIYAPPLAGPRSKISGTMQNDTSGPTGYYVAVFDSRGDTKYYHGTTDERGKYKFVLPAAAAAFMVFREFDRNGKPDEGARCAVSSDPAAAVANTRPAFGPSAPAGAPQIVRGNSVYERGTPMTIQTTRADGYAARVLVDGSPQYTETLAASDRSVVAQVSRDAPLGRHELSVQSNGKQSQRVPVDLIGATLSASGSHETGGIQTAVLTVTGLGPNEHAIANFEVTGSAQLASGGNRTSVPVVDNRATVDVRGTRAGEAIIHWNLRVNIPPVWSEVAELTPPPPTPTPYPYYTTSRPSPEPTPKRTPTPTPSPNNDRTTGRDVHTTPPPTNVRTPRPHTTVRPSPTPPPPTPTAYPTPSTSPSPTPPPCNYEMEDGWFEPTQGVWQDDPFFPNMPGKQISRLHDLDPVPHFFAELDMIEGRDTVLFGVNHYMDQTRRVDINSRHVIVLAFKTNCSQNKPAHIAFTVIQRGRKQLIMSSPDYQIPIEGPRNADPTMKEFVVRLPVGSGLPATPFLLDEGGYDIHAELVTSSGDQTGLEVVVTGDTVVTHPPTLHFVPMYLFYGATPPPMPSGPGTTVGAIISVAEALRAESASMIPDYYPIAPFSLPTIRERFWYVSHDAIANSDLSDAARFLAGYVLSGFDQDNADIFANLPVVERFMTGVAHTQGFAGYITGANRMVIVMRATDYDQIMGSPKIASYNLGNKAVLMRAGVNSDTVAHEVAHSIPPPNWNPDPECNFPYHNTGVTGVVSDPYGTGTTANGYAAGERLRLNGVRRRVFTDGTIHIMGGAITGVTVKRVYAYIEQCTYWHLKNEMLDPPDPRLVLVRGAIARSGRKFAAALGPSYTLAGTPDLKVGGRGAWHITLTRADGSTIADYAFDPSWIDENGRARNELPFAYRVPAAPDLSAIVLSGEGRRLTLRFSASPPAIRILSPGARAVAGKDGSVRVRWQTSVEKGYVAVSSVFLSEDGGKTYSSQVLETLGNTATVLVNPKKHSHRIKLVVSDYSQSSEKTLDFRT